jgi:hypothetical protein
MPTATSISKTTSIGGTTVRLRATVARAVRDLRAPKRLPTQLPREKPMSNKVSSLKSQIDEFSGRQGIAGEMIKTSSKRRSTSISYLLCRKRGSCDMLSSRGGTALRHCYGADC